MINTGVSIGDLLVMMVKLVPVPKMNLLAAPVFTPQETSGHKLSTSITYSKTSILMFLLGSCLNEDSDISKSKYLCKIPQDPIFGFHDFYE